MLEVPGAEASLLLMVVMPDIEPQNMVVTGGAGFIGSHLCEALMRMGHNVTAIDNLSSGRLENVGHLKRDPGFTLHIADVCASRDFLPRGIKPDAIFYLAGHASPMAYATRPLETLMSSATGLQHSLDYALEFKCPLVFASTSEVYGDPEVVPTPEEYWGRVNTLGPRAPYDIGKKFGETLCWSHHKAHETDARIIRIFNTYGPRMGRGDGRVVPTFTSQAILGEPLTVQGTGEHTRAYLYVEDCVAGLLKALERGKPVRPVNIGGTSEMTVKELAALVIRLVGSKSEVLHISAARDDPTRRCPDLTRAREELGWEPKVLLEDGLNKTIEWMRRWV